MTADDASPQIALIGFGEAGQAFAQGWQQQGVGPVAAFDLAGTDPAAHAALQARAQALGVALHTDRAAALAGVPHVFCLVTADRALQAARECAPHLAPGALWFDGNSCAPDTKRAAARVIEAAGGRYVDTAVMAPVHPKLHRTPLFLAGPHADEAAALLAGWGMQARVLGAQVGDASTVKMLRSVMIKGMEALTAECVLAARKAGLEDQVIDTLIASNPEIDWPRQGAYNLERMMQHGQRRASEMREVVVTLQDLGFPGAISAAVADWHQRIGDLGLRDADGDLTERADSILARL
ncbi:MAG: NAD(P)-dependent oxidoreductase [Rhodobacterales bacterium]|nr:NAD(P)-dependent oxidoreductase [Rhodobacterales bacterium]